MSAEWLFTWAVQTLALMALAGLVVRLPVCRARAAARSGAWSATLALCVGLVAWPWPGPRATRAPGQPDRVSRWLPRFRRSWFRSQRAGWPEPGRALVRLSHETRLALEAATRGEIAGIGPRGGKRWTARTFIRRSAWHALDHAWEIEDRLAKGEPR